MARVKQVAKQVVDSTSDSDQEEVYEARPKSLKGLAVDLMYPIQDFSVDLNLEDAANKLWLKKIRLWEYANLQWEKHRNNIYAPTQLASLQKGTLMVGIEHEMTVSYFADVLKLQNDGLTSWEKSTEGMMKRSPEGSQSYYMIRKVKDAARRKQLVWLMKSMFFIIKTTYMSRDNYGLIAAVESGENINWAYLLYNRFHAEVLGSDRRKQGGNKLAPMLSILFDHAKENMLALKLSSMKATPVAKATMAGKKEKKPVVESDESDEPPPRSKKARLEEEASVSHKSSEGAQIQEKVMIDMMKLGFAQSEVQNAVEETWIDINSKLEETL